MFHNRLLRNLFMYHCAYFDASVSLFFLKTILIYVNIPSAWYSPHTLHPLPPSCIALRTSDPLHHRSRASTTVRSFPLWNWLSEDEEAFQAAREVRQEWRCDLLPSDWKRCTWHRESSRPARDCAPRECSEICIHSVFIMVKWKRPFSLKNFRKNTVLFFEKNNKKIY